MREKIEKSWIVRLKTDKKEFVKEQFKNTVNLIYENLYFIVLVMRSQSCFPSRLAASGERKFPIEMIASSCGCHCFYCLCSGFGGLSAEKINFTEWKVDLSIEIQHSKLWNYEKEKSSQLLNSMITLSKGSDSDEGIRRNRCFYELCKHQLFLKERI